MPEFNGQIEEKAVVNTATRSEVAFEIEELVNDSASAVPEISCGCST